MSYMQRPSNRPSCPYINPGLFDLCMYSTKMCHMCSRHRRWEEQQREERRKKRKPSEVKQGE